MSDALQAAADTVTAMLGDFNVPIVLAGAAMEPAFRAWLQHPDIAGCDCDNGQREGPMIGKPPGSHPLLGHKNYEPCTRCVVVWVPDKNGIEVRVRKEYADFWIVGNQPAALRIPLVPAEEGGR